MESLSIEIPLFTKYLESNCAIRKSTALYFFRKLFAINPNMAGIPNETEYFTRIKNAILKSLRKKTTLDEEGQINAIWIITNMCCISQEVNHMFVNSNCIEVLMNGLKSSNEKLASQAIWAIANISADCVECKSKCRSVRVFSILAKKLASRLTSDDQDRRNIIWCINNLTSGGRVYLPKNNARFLVTSLVSSFLGSDGQPSESASKILWSLANIADDLDNAIRIDLILSHNNFLKLVMGFFMDPKHSRLHAAALRFMGNIAVGSDEQTDILINTINFKTIMTIAMETPEHRSEAAWIFSNIAAGLPRHIDFLLNINGFYAWIVEGIHSKEKRFKKECLWVIGNLLASCDELQMDKLVNMGVVQNIPNLLQIEDIRLNEKALQAALRILRDYPWQRQLFIDLNIPNCIDEILLTEDAPPLYAHQKRTIERMLADTGKNLRKDNRNMVISYSKIKL